MDADSLHDTLKDVAQQLRDIDGSIQGIDTGVDTSGIEGSIDRLTEAIHDSSTAKRKDDSLGEKLRTQLDRLREILKSPITYPNESVCGVLWAMGDALDKAGQEAEDCDDLQVVHDMVRSIAPIARSFTCECGSLWRLETRARFVLLEFGEGKGIKRGRNSEDEEECIEQRITREREMGVPLTPEQKSKFNEVVADVRRLRRKFKWFRTRVAAICEVKEVKEEGSDF